MDKEDKVIKHGMEAGEGYKWVLAHYENDENPLVDDQQFVKTARFEEGEVPGRAWYSVSRKVQVKQYEPLEIAVGCSLPCRKEEVVSAIREAVKIVQSEFQTQMKEIMSYVRKSR